MYCVFCFAGSENNSLYVYYKGLSKQLLTFKFETVKSVLVCNIVIVCKLLFSFLRNYIKIIKV
jgi:hypothetical protein